MSDRCVCKVRYEVVRRFLYQLREAKQLPPPAAPRVREIACWIIGGAQFSLLNLPILRVIFAIPGCPW